MKEGYEKIPDLENFYFEDSFVIGIHELPNTLIFDVEAAITKNSKYYARPKTGEQYCYKIIKIIFDEVDKIVWEDRVFSRSVDAAGAVDFGNIDTFTFQDHTYELEGDWGKVKVTAGRVRVEYVS